MTDNLYNTSSQLMKEHRWDEVLQLLNPTTLKESNSWKLYWNAAWTNYKIGKFNNTVEYFKTALELTNHPKDTSVCLTFLGISEIELKNYEQALEYLRKSLHIKDNSLTRKSLALAHMHLNNNEAAEQVHKEGIANEPNNKERLAAYGDFLLDIGREEDVKEIERTIKNLE